MKFKNIGATIVLAAAAFICSCTKSSCDPPVLYTEVDSTSVDNSTEESTNPSFTAPSEIVAFQVKTLRDYKTEEIFLSMPQDVLQNVSIICLKYMSNVTINDIVAEYLSNRTVYDGLHVPEETNSPPEAKDSIITEEQHTPRYKKDTLTDGRVVLVEVE